METKPQFKLFEKKLEIQKHKKLMLNSKIKIKIISETEHLREIARSLRATVSI